MARWHQPESMGGDFGFQVGRYGDRNVVWVAQLPHQCDSWEIGGSEDPQRVLADLKTFIGEAGAAYERLAALIAEDAANQDPQTPSR